MKTRTLAVLVSLGSLVACGGDGGADAAHGSTNGGGAAGSTSTAAGGSGGAGGEATGGSGGAGGEATGGSGGAGGEATGGSGATGGAGGLGGGLSDPCLGVECPADQHCEANVCVNSTCADLSCAVTEICETTPGGGALCKDIGCSSDVECNASQHCNGVVCEDDVCTPGETTCVGDELHECTANGGSDPVKFACGSQSYFPSACTDAGDGKASCGCEDDWDCPEFTVCDGSACVGTGKEPTCTLQPVPFKQVLPTNEIQWGGKDKVDLSAKGAPFALSAQVSITPLVVNLDDDNGDGLINELDFPEIVFMTYNGMNLFGDGVIRAIHGGGPNKGKDYFATCGATVWHEGDALNKACTLTTALGNSTAALAAGDLDGDGVPEIVVPTENAGLQILDNRGEIIATSAGSQWTGYSNPAITIANVDQQGFAELIVGSRVFTLAHDANKKLVFVDRFDGALMAGKNGQGPVSCVANVAGDARQEIVAGTTVYALPEPPAGVTKRADCAPGAVDPFCTGTLTVVWDGQTVNGAAALPNAQRDGFCAVADVLGQDEAAAPGPSNPLDGKAEVVLVANGRLLVLNGETGALRRSIDLGAGTLGGAPNLDDFDGDGFPEVGTAFGAAYIMHDLQASAGECPAWPIAIADGVPNPNPARKPGGACTVDADCGANSVCNTTAESCVCLHNGWRRLTEDDSSRVTSSSVFDFNGDGAAEVVYNDECFFRVYDGTSSETLFKHPSPSRTRIENPAIADVDNDGNAEIVFSSNNDTNFCSQGSNYPNGIAVWGDASDTWVSARRIWNQHAYHVTNVTEGGGIPVKEPESWKTYNGRRYNTYRSNPRSFGVAPDLTVAAIEVSSPDAVCGTLSDLLNVTVSIENKGDLRTGPGVVVKFYGTWAGVEEPLLDAGALPITSVLQTNLEPGFSVLITVSYEAGNNPAGTLPDAIRVVVDEANQERECDEGNNERSVPVDAGMARPDLRIDLGLASADTCPSPTVETTVANDGSAPAEDIVVRYYAGDPNQGGTPIHDELIPGPLAPGQSVTFTAALVGFPDGKDILVYAIVDPDQAIAECNKGNNKDQANDKLGCNVHQ